MHSYNLYTLHPDLDLVIEWVYFSILEEYGNEELFEKIDNTFNSVFSGIPIITEKEIDEAIQDTSSHFKRWLDMGDWTKEEYKEACREQLDRDYIKNELLESDSEYLIGDAIAACELLCAVMGYPTKAFQQLMKYYAHDKTLMIKFEQQQKDCDKKIFLNLLPKGIKIIKKCKQKDTMKALGVIGEDNIRSWLDSVAELENKFETIEIL